MLKGTSWNKSHSLEIELENKPWTSDQAINEILGEGQYLAINIELTCKGYFQPANYSGHPDNWTPEDWDDERTINSISIIYFNEDGDDIKDMEIDKGFYSLFENAFGKEIDQIEIMSTKE